MSLFTRTFMVVAALVAVATVAVAGPYLINAQQADFRSRPEYIRDHFAHIETLPFDGLAITTASGAQLMNGTPRAPADMARDFAPLSRLAFKRMLHNFAWVNVDRPTDFFGDWSVTIENFRSFAKTLKDHELKGIFFDNEEYARALFNYPEDCSDPSKSLADYQQQARRRGRQIAEAIASEFPELVMVVLHGPYSSHAGTPDAVRAGQTRWEIEELRGAFTVGLMEGMDSRARLVDGGELYAYRTAADFQASYEYRKQRLASAEADCPFIPLALRSVWAQKLSVAFGLYNRPFPTGATMNPATLRTALEHALRRCDDYTWLYFEGANWNAPGEIATAWTDAVTAARASASEPTRPSSPTVSITSPAIGATFTAPSALTLRADASVANATLAKVEFFDGAIKLGKAINPPWTFVWSQPQPGDRILTAWATAAGGAITVSSPVAITISSAFSAKINFQPASVTPAGYFADTGAVYASRGDGLSYGWNTSHVDGMRHREGTGDVRRATLCQIREGGVWEIAVPNGDYEVTVAIGDGEYASVHTVRVEGAAFWEAQPLAKGAFVSRTRTVTVADGRLTLDQGAAGHERTRVNYLLIATANSSPAAPGGLTAAAISSREVELRWLDHSSNESGFTLERALQASFADAVEIAALPADQTTYTDAATAPGLTHHYRILARNAAGASPFSNPASVTLAPLDVDADRIPDAQEITPCVVGIDDSRTDSDGDGVSNAAEWHAGTDSRDSRSLPRIDEIRATGKNADNPEMQISFLTAAGRRYFVDYSDTLASAIWTRLPGSDRLGNGAVQSVVDTTVGGSRFYRLRVFP